MQLNPSEISELIRTKIQNLPSATEARTTGTVISVTDGIVRIHGLKDVMQGEMLEFPGNTFGLAMHLRLAALLVWRCIATMTVITRLFCLVPMLRCIRPKRKVETA